MKLFRVLNVLWKISCVFCFVYYAIDISQQYLAYPTITNSEVMSQLKFPAVSLAIYGDTSNVDLNNVVTPRHALTDEILDFTLNYTIYPSSGMTVITFVTHEYVTLIKLSIVGLQHLYHIAYIQSHDVPFSIMSTRLHMINYGAQMLLTFSRITFRQLPYPFTYCKNYKPSRQKIYAECLNRDIHNVEKECLKLIPSMDCNEEFFTSDQNQVNHYWHNSSEYVLYEKSSGLRLVMMDIISIEMYILYLGGLLGAWLGFAFADLITPLNYVSKLGMKFSLSSKHQKTCTLSFIWTLCVLGCFYQVSQVSLSYFKYEISSEILVSKPVSGAEIPDISFCFMWKDLLENKSMDTRRILTYRDVYSNTENYIKSIAVGSYNKEYTIQVQVYFSATYQCYRMRPIKKHVLDGYRIIHPSFRVPLLYVMQRQVPYHILLSSKFKNYLPPNYLDQFHLATSRFVLRGYHVVTNFAYIKYTLLPWPFATKCVDYLYPPQDFTSREDCVYACLWEEFGIMFAASHPTEKEIQNEIKTDHHFADQLSLCKSHCPIACDNSEYEFVNLHLKKASSSVSMVRNAAFETKIIMSPKTQLLDYFIYIASCLGFWLLLSVKDISKYILLIIKQRKMFRRFRKWIKPFVKSVSFVGFVYHTSVVTEDYFGYKVTSETRFHADRVPTQSFSLCFELLRIVKRSSDRRDLITCIKQESCVYSLAQINAMTLGLDDILSNVILIAQDSKTYITSQKSGMRHFLERLITTYITPFESKCFLLRTNKIFDKSKAITHNGLQLVLGANLSSLNLHGILFFGDKYEVSQDAGYVVDSTSSVFTSSLIESRLLPYPYTTKCFEYRSINLKNREFCLSECYWRRVLHRTGKHLINSLRTDLNNTVSKRWIFGLTTDDYHKCVAKCKRVDCIGEIHFEVNKITLEYLPFHFALKPISLLIRIDYSPKTSFTQFILLLTGVLGLWLGLDVISILSTSRKISKRFRLLIRNHSTGKHHTTMTG